MKSFTVLSLVLFFFVQSLVLAEPVSGTNKKTKTDAAATAVGLKQFGFDLFKSLKAAGGEDAVAISPLSIGEALALATNGSELDTKVELEGVLGSKVATLNTGLKNIRESLNDFAKRSNGIFEYKSANSLWANSNPSVGFTFEPNFLKTAKRLFEATLETRDFATLIDKGEHKGEQKAVVDINDWVGKQTNHKITKLLTKLNDNDVAVILNAIYAKGKFSNHFSELSEAIYGSVDGALQHPVSMMTKTENMDYYLDEQTGLEAFSFKVEASPDEEGAVRDQIALDILVPKTGGVTELAKVLDAAYYNKVVAGLQPQMVKLTMPAGKIVQGKAATLKPVLEQPPFNMLRIFSDSLAQFNPLGSVEDKAKLYVSDILTKTFYETSPFGFEAAAATAVVLSKETAGINPPEPIQRTIASSSLHVIRHIPSGLPLFIVEYDRPKRYTQAEIVELVREGHKTKRRLTAETEEGKISAAYDEKTKKEVIALVDENYEILKVLATLD